MSQRHAGVGAAHVCDQILHTHILSPTHLIFLPLFT
jgi:hypothetical protein